MSPYWSRTRGRSDIPPSTRAIYEHAAGRAEALGRNYCPKLLTDIGGGMITPWDAIMVSKRPRPVFDRDGPRRFSIANKADCCRAANSRRILAPTCAAEEPAQSCQALERRRIGLAPRGNPRGNGAARQITADRSDHEAVVSNEQIASWAARGSSDGLFDPWQDQCRSCSI